MRKLFALLMVCLLGVLSPIARADGEAAAATPDYGAVLDAYYRAVDEGWEAEELDEAGLNFMVQWLEDGRNQLGYALIDVDCDGVCELLIGQVEEPGQCGVVFDLYTWDGEAPVLVFQGWDRNVYQLRADGTFFNWGSGSAFESVQRIYCLDAQSLLFVEGVYFDARYDEENPWFFTLDDDWDASNDTPLTEEEATAITDGYAQTLIPVGFTPLAAQDW